MDRLVVEACEEPWAAHAGSLAKAYFRLLGMIGMMGTIWHHIMLSGFCIWHDGGMTGDMTVKLSCHSQADS